MSKQNIVNPDHYTVAGRERPSEHDLPRQRQPMNSRPRQQGQDGSRNFIPGAAPVGEKPEGKKGRSR